MKCERVGKISTVDYQRLVRQQTFVRWWAEKKTGVCAFCKTREAQRDLSYPRGQEREIRHAAPGRKSVANLTSWPKRQQQFSLGFWIYDRRKQSL
jgi:hypothetical protein